MQGRELAQARGRRGTARHEQLEMLQFLITVAKGPVQQLEARPRRSAARVTCARAVLVMGWTVDV